MKIALTLGFWKAAAWFALAALLAPASLTFAAESGVFSVESYGAVGDGVTLNTLAIQKAIDACSAGGGGFIQFSRGRFLTGTIQLKDNVSLRLSAEAVILGSTHAADYRNLDPFVSGDGYKLGHALIVAVNANHVGLQGAGTIDGQGRLLKAAQKTYTVRPFLIRWLRCTDVTVKDVHLTGPGAWTLNFFQSSNATVDHVTIRSRGLANNDGIDLDSCQGVRISNCDIDSGDDALCLKSTSPQPCRDIVATDCKLRTSCNGIKLGTESLGDFQNIQISRCDLRDIGMSGIALYSVDGAHLSDVTISDITMKGVTVPIAIRLGSRLKTFRPVDHARQPGVIRNIAIDQVRATGAKQIGLLINGVPGHAIEALSLSNINIELAGGGTSEAAKVHLPEKEAAYPEYNTFGRVMPAYGIYMRHARDVTFKNVHMSATKPDVRPEIIFIDVQGVSPESFGAGTRPAENIP